MGEEVNPALQVIVLVSDLRLAPRPVPPPPPPLPPLRLQRADAIDRFASHYLVNLRLANTRLGIRRRPSRVQRNRIPR
jgi:hypothetical protein